MMCFANYFKLRKVSPFIGVYVLLMFFLPILYWNSIVNDSGSGSNADTTTTPPAQNLDENIFNENITFDQEDERILKYIRTHHLTPPSKEKYNLNATVSAVTYKLHTTLDKKLAEFLKGKKNGVFVECGALDGELYSHTLRLEKDHNWSGLLIEAAPKQIPILKSKNRKAWIVDACLSSHPEQIVYLERVGSGFDRKGNGQILPYKKYRSPTYFQMKKYVKVGTVDCFPLLSVLSAANISSVDLLILDVEGHEYNILNAIPFERTKIEWIMVEHWLAPEGKTVIRKLMESKSYILIYENVSDLIFHRNFNESLQTRNKTKTIFVQN